MIKSILIWLMSYIGLFAMRYIYGPWSRFYRHFFENKYNKLPNDLPWDEGKLLDFFNKCTWTKDKWYMGFVNLFNIIRNCFRRKK